MRCLVIAVVSSCAPVFAAAACFDDAAARYGVSPQLLCAVATCESGLRADAVNETHRARTGTVDYGLMQINSGHLPWLRQYGITQQHLMDACTNVQVGAYILAEKLQRYGNTWEAVGAYNAACTQLKGDKCVEARSKYAWCVQRRLAQCADPAVQAARVNRSRAPVTAAAPAVAATAAAGAP